MSVTTNELQIRIIGDSVLRLERGDGEIGQVPCLARAYRRQGVDTWDLYVGMMQPAGVATSQALAVAWITTMAVAA